MCVPRPFDSLRHYTHPPNSSCPAKMHDGREAFALPDDASQDLFSALSGEMKGNHAA